jgi:glycosyltransferase involved in cell wall biosynthesis
VAVVSRPASAARAVRGPICYVAWGSVAGRSEELAASIGGEARCFFPPGGRVRPPMLLRYLCSVVGTAWYLFTRRPSVVIVTNPPIFAAAAASLCARVIGATLVLDSHPGGFGAQGDRVAARFQGMHRRLVARSAAVMVTDERWGDVVRSWGGTPVVVHEAPTDWVCPPPARHPRLRVLVVGRFARDEPIAEAMEAARRLPGCDFLMTGYPEFCPAELREAATENVHFVGFLDPEQYRAAVCDADVVLTLTTEPTSVMRAAYEAVYARRPLIVSDWPIARALFPHASLAANDGSSIAAAVVGVQSDYERLVARLEEARRLQLARFEDQRAALVQAISAAL